MAGQSGLNAHTTEQRRRLRSIVLGRTLNARTVPQVRLFNCRSQTGIRLLQPQKPNL